MARVRIFRQLFPSYLLLLVAALTVAGWYSTRAFRQFYLEQISTDLEQRARILGSTLAEDVQSGDFEHLDRLVKGIGESAETRVTVILPDGQVVADSQHEVPSMENHRDRPEIAKALEGMTGQSVRYSDTLHQELDYVAVPLVLKGKVIGVVRSAIGTGAIEQALQTIQRRIAYGGVLVVLLAALVAFLASRKISRPLETLASGARRLADGELGHRLVLPDTVEIADVAHSINKMAHRLKGKIHDLEHERKELEALLGGMAEGVIALDNERRITKVNAAAAALLNENQGQIEGKLVHEVYRNADFLHLVDEVFNKEDPQEAELSFYHPAERTMLAHGAVLKTPESTISGALFVLSDITKLRRLEQVRKDFVANVSHELKTPITSIKGFAETLLQGGMKDGENAKRFISIIDKHAERLRAIIDDLLTLSRLERSGTEQQLEKRMVRVRSLVSGALEACQRTLIDRDIEIETKIPDDLACFVNESLIEQAMVNLIDNAAKYGPRSSKIQVKAEELDSEIVLSVIDQGPGIEGKHLERVFERFYRIDPGRSREAGGTGLGLAIVKHIAAVHGGYPAVTSNPGSGSTFSLHLPIVRTL